MSIIFIFHSRNHVRLSAQSIISLRNRGQTILTFDLADIIGNLEVREECRKLLGTPSQPVSEAENLVAPGDLVIVGCDWAPVGGRWLDIIARLRGLGAILIGLMEGCKWLESDRYRIVDYLLSYAPAADAAYSTRAPPPEIRLVGSPTIEQSLSATGSPSAQPHKTALLNFKEINPPYPYARDEFWLENALNACTQCVCVQS